MLDKHNNSKSEGLRWSLPNDRQHRHEESSCQKNEVEQQQESKNDSQKADGKSHFLKAPLHWRMLLNFQNCLLKYKLDM